MFAMAAPAAASDCAAPKCAVCAIHSARPTQGRGLARPLLIRWRAAGAPGAGPRMERAAMSSFDNPFDPDRRLGERDASAAGTAARPSTTPRSGSSTARAAASEDKRYQGVVASAVMRAVFPQDAARRAFLKSVGASTALAALSQFFPLKTATEVFAQGGAIEKKDLKVGFIPDHLRHADHHGAPHGLLQQARPQRGGDQDRRLGGHPRQDPQQGIRRRPHALADAARDHARRRLERRSPTPCRRSRTSTARPSRSRSSTRTRHDPEAWKGFKFAVPFDYSMHNYLLRYYVAEHGLDPDTRHPDPRRAAARDGGEPACRQHRRLSRPRSVQPARRL